MIIDFELPLRISSSNMNELTRNAVEFVLNNGRSIQSRYGHTLELDDVSLFLTSPRNRHLYLYGRKNNIFATIGETFWVLSGSDKIFPVLQFFLPRAVEFSDDYQTLPDDEKHEATWRGAYGTRIFAYGQIDNIINAFKKNLNARRAVMTVWQPERDTELSMNMFQGIKETVDVPCSQNLNFWIRDNKLNLKFLIRSNDVIWGFSHINLFEFTVLMEMMAQLITSGCGLKKPLELGYFHYNATSFHIYDRTLQQAEDIVDLNKSVIEAEKVKKMIFPDFLENPGFAVQLFFGHILQTYSWIINPDDSPYGGLVDFHEYVDALKEVFYNFSVPTKDNQLWDYAFATLAFVYNNILNIIIKTTKDEKLPPLVGKIASEDFSDDFWHAICNSTFRNFEIDVRKPIYHKIFDMGCITTPEDINEEVK